MTTERKPPPPDVFRELWDEYGWRIGAWVMIGGTLAVIGVVIILTIGMIGAFLTDVLAWLT